MTTPQNKPATLFGAAKYETRKGLFDADAWAKMRAGDAHGHLVDETYGRVIYFFDVGARDEFVQLFGGLPVRLDRVKTGVIHDLKEAKEVLS